MKKRIPLIALFVAIGLHVMNFKSNAQFSETKLLVGEDISNFSISAAPDGYIVAGTTTDATLSRDIKVMRLSSAGNPIWSKVIDGDDTDRNMHISTVSDGYILTGMCRAASGTNLLFFLHLDAAGNITLKKKFYDANRDDWSLTGLHVLEMDNGQGYLLTGYIKEEGFIVNINKSAFLMHIDKGGKKVWAKYYDSPNTGDSDFDMASFALKVDDGYYITGSANVDKPGGGSTQGVLSMKINGHGDVEWVNNFAIDPGDRWEENMDVGTGAIIDERYIVVSANSSLDHSFYVTKVDPANGSIVSNHMNFIPHMEANTPSFTIGKNASGNFIIGGMIGESGTKYDCDDNIMEIGAVSFVSELSNDLDQVLGAKKYLMHNPDFKAGEGSNYNSHFGGPSGLNNPIIATPEMVYADPNGNNVAILAYAQDKTLGAGHYDLQFIANSSPDFDWCHTRDILFEPVSAQAVYDPDMTAMDVLNIEETDQFNESNNLVTTDHCRSGGNFPYIDSDIQSYSDLGALPYRTLEYINGYTYVMAFRSCNAGYTPYIKKYDPTGGLVWERTTSASTVPMSGNGGIEVDNSGNVYVAGALKEGDLQWDESNLSIIAPTLPWHSRTSYIVKYDANGNFLWQAAGFPDPAMSGALYSINDYEVGPDGYLYVTGVTSGDVSFKYGMGAATSYSNDPIMGGPSISTSPGGSDHSGFIAKYNPANGQLVYIKTESLGSLGALNEFKAESIVTHPVTGDLYVAGHNSALGTLNVMRFSGAGSLLNNTPTTITTPVSVYAMDLEGDDLYIAGESSGSSLTFGATTLSNGSNRYPFIARFAVNSLSFVRGQKITSSPTSSYVAITDILAMPGGSEVFVLGHTYAQSTNYHPSGGNLPKSGVSDIFIAKYNNQLTNAYVDWPALYGGGGTEARAGGLALDEEYCGVVYSGSFTGGSIDLGYGTSYSASLPVGSCSTSGDFFVARAMPSNAAAYRTGSNDENGDANSGVDNESFEASGDNKGDLSIYPNPAKTAFYINGLAPGEKVLFINSTGQVVDTYIAESKELKISTANRASGIYFIRIPGRNDRNVGKIIFE